MPREGQPDRLGPHENIRDNTCCPPHPGAGYERQSRRQTPPRRLLQVQEHRHGPGHHQGRADLPGVQAEDLSVETLEWGTNISQEKRDKGFTHCFILSFKSEKDRDTYIDHPQHKAFGKLVGPLLDDVFVIDFWSKK